MAKKRVKRLTKKSSGKNLLIRILTVSTLATLAIALYLNRPRPIPISINEVSSLPASNCAQVAFTDNFGATTLDNSKWFAYEFYSDGTATIDDSSLTLTIPPSKSSWPKMFVNTEDKVVLEGDFVQEITLNSLASTPTDQLSSFVLGLVAVKPDDSKHWYRTEVYSNGDIQTHGTTDGVTTSGTAVNAFKNTPTKLKMVRKGSTLETYYKTDDRYVLHHTLNNIYPGKMFVQLILLSHPDSNPATTAVVDDYKLGCRPPRPTGLKHTCSPDATKATFSWDDISPSKKYHFGLMDLTQKPTLWNSPDSTSHWRGGDLETNTYELPVIPGRQYQWFVQTNSDGPLSVTSPSANFNFSCEPKPAVPTNPRHTCSPDGKSVRFVWDGVLDVDSYKIRLDDKNGKVVNFDNVKDAQFIATITPGKAYSWWLHSNKGGYDSNQTTSIDFTCNITSTPTPTQVPTPKPTVIPTVKPSPKASVTPTPTAYPSTSPRVLFDNTPNTIPDDFPSPSPLSTSTSTKSNPISRFFSWLASLFE